MSTSTKYRIAAISLTIGGISFIVGGFLVDHTIVFFLIGIAFLLIAVVFWRRSLNVKESE
jgi:hypothetical protein